MIKIKEGFKGERFVSLPEELLNRYSKDPLIGNLYPRKIGYFPKVKYHYIQKPGGSDYAMLIYCTDGKGWYSIHGKKYSIEKNEYVIIPPYTPYSFGADKETPWTIYWLHFRGKLIQSFLSPTYTPISILPEENSRLNDRLDLFEEIYSCFSMAYIADYMFYSSACLYVFLSSFKCIEQYRHIRMSRKEYSFASRVIHYMQENIESKLTLNQLANYFQYSPSHFSMLFKQETNFSPIDYFLRLKIQRACQLIELTDWKLNNIAAKLGFEEAAYFSNLFTRIMGVSPSSYRKQESENSGFQKK